MQRPIILKNCFIIIFLVITSHSFSQFRVVGYVQPWRGIAPDVNKISFQNITHLNIAFVNPDSAGNLVIPAGFDSLIQTAHEHSVKVLASIGGGYFNPYYAALLADTNRKVFIGQLKTFLVEHNLDGIDVDLENDNASDKNYNIFIAELSTALKPLHKLLTAALATWNAQVVSKTSLKKFDFINIMSYDNTGPWEPGKPGPHSTYNKAKEDLHYWTHIRGLPKSKLNLGLPFYGYCFGTTYGESMSYSEILTTFPTSELRDSVIPTSGGVIYYNGLPIIKKKTVMALKNAGGVMIWQLLQDSDGEKSLLKAINGIIKNFAYKR